MSLKKLLEKANWYNKRRRNAIEDEKLGSRKNRGKRMNNKVQTEQPAPKTLLFVEQTNDGELASRLRELVRRLSPTIGFSIKIVERAGSPLRSRFPLASL